MTTTARCFGVSLASAAVSLPSAYAAALRTGAQPVLARIERDRCLLDLRALDPQEDDVLQIAVIAARLSMVGAAGGEADTRIETCTS